jgi:predicted MPP superfamily phosphohydrolase
MKTIILGDTHGRSNWKLAVHQDKPDRVIFIGDYFDSFEISGVEQIANFKEIIKYKEDNPQVEVVLLIGNHDHHYFPEVGYTGTSGYQSGIAPSITQVIDENRHHLQMAYGFGEYLFTHAGVSPVFMDQVFGEEDFYEGENWRKENVVVDLNELFRYKPKAFDFNGFESSGDNTTQTPIWIRPRSLMAANKKHKKGLKKDYIQIVGHTAMRRIDLKGSDQFTGGRYYFIDTMETSGNYLVIQDNQITVNSVR